jgi:hypothetical protein
VPTFLFLNFLFFVCFSPLQEKYPPLNFPMPPKGCTNEAVKKIIACLNEASENLADWKDLAFTSLDDISPYFGDELEEDQEEEERSENSTVTVTIADDIDADQEER